LGLVSYSDQNEERLPDVAGKPLLVLIYVPKAVRTQEKRKPAELSLDVSTDLHVQVKI